MLKLTIFLLSLVIAATHASRGCPYLPPGTIGSCIQACSSDADCLVNQKCCSNGCGHVCTDIGGCPRVRCPVCDNGSHLIIENRCLKCRCGKFQCPVNTKLCINCPNGYKKDKNGCKTCECLHKESFTEFGLI